MGKAHRTPERTVTLSIRLTADEALRLGMIRSEFSDELGIPLTTSATIRALINNFRHFTGPEIR